MAPAPTPDGGSTHTYAAGSPALLAGVLPPPAGITPDFDHPETRQHQVVVCVIVCVVFLSLFVSARLYSKRFITYTLGWDDYTCVLSLAFIAVFMAAAIEQTHVGTGLHLWEIRLGIWLERDLVGFQLWNVISYVFFIAALGTIKLSILILYLRLLVPGMKLRFVVYGLMAIIIGTILAFDLSIIFGCRPIAALYHPTVKATFCLNLADHTLAHSVIDIITDFIIVLIPIPMVWSMNLPKRDKIGVFVIFSTGLIVCAISLGGLWSIVDGFSSDATWKEWYIIIFSIIRVALSIIASCMPSLKPLAQHFFPWLRRHKSLASFHFRPSPQSWRSPDSDQANDEGLTKFESPASSARAPVLSDRMDRSSLGFHITSNGSWAAFPRDASEKAFSSKGSVAQDSRYNRC